MMALGSRGLSHGVKLETWLPLGYRGEAKVVLPIRLHIASAARGLRRLRCFLFVVLRLVISSLEVSKTERPIALRFGAYQLEQTAQMQSVMACYRSCSKTKMW